MLKIVAKRGNQRHELLEKEEDPAEAERLAAEYQVAFRDDWKVSVLPSHGQTIVQQVIELRRQGLPNSQIATRLKRGLNRINQITGSLAKIGQVERRLAGAKPIFTERDEIIAMLRDCGIGPKEIAVLMGLGYLNVRGIVHRLRHAGRLPHDPEST